MESCEEYYIQEYFEILEEEEKIKSSAMYLKALRSLEKSQGHELLLSDLNEELLKQWIDAIAPRMSADSITRYIESISRIHAIAVKEKLAERTDMFERAKCYLNEISHSGLDKRTLQQIDDIRSLASTQTIDSPSVAMAIDIFLASFYLSGCDIATIIEMRTNDSQFSHMPQLEAIREKYSGEARRYIFPLKQWQTTTNALRKSVESSFTLALRAYGIELNGKSPAEFIATTWAAAAKACGISTADICACCPSATANPQVKEIAPSRLSATRINAIRRRVANTIIDMNSYWYAIRFIGKEEYVRNEIERLAAGATVKIYYPMEEICHKVKKKIVKENKPTIRNIIFLQTMPETLLTIVRNKPQESQFYVVRNNARKENSFAIIPNEQMIKFSTYVSNGLDILGDDDMRDVEIVKGSYVCINEGPYAGYHGHVLKVRKHDNSSATMLHIKADTLGSELCNLFGSNLYITIPQELVSCVEE